MTGALVVLLLLLAASADAQVAVDNQHVSGGGGPAIINHGNGTRITGSTDAPTTVRNTIFDLDLGLNDWPNGPQLIDAASISSINTLSGSTTPRSFYGFELAVTRTRASYSLPHVGGANAIRGMEITLHDDHDPWETPHDTDRWTGLGIYAHQGRRLGTGLVIGGAVGFDQPFVILGRDGREMFRVDGAGTVYLHGRALVIDADGSVRAR